MPLSQLCLRCGLSFEISDHHLQFLERAAPRACGQVLTYDRPRYCPSCRDQGRLAWRNDRSLYARECGLCKKRVISCYSPVSGITVYCSSCWNSDAWNPLDYGRDYDPRRPFLEQFSELLRTIPHLALYNLNHENSEYCNHAADMKDSYLVFASAINEKTMYATRTWKNVNCVDIVESGENESCYSILDCHNCYQLSSSLHCTHCADSAFLFDCHSCRSCFGSANLRQAQYIYFNRQLTKAEYLNEIARLDLSSFDQRSLIAAKVDQHWGLQVHRHAFLTGCEGCNGDQLDRSKDSTYCFNLSEAHDCHYCELGFSPKDSYDASGISAGELCYGVMNHLGSNRVCSGVVTYYNDSCHYSYHCQSCKDSIGAVGLRHQQYVILNKRYPRDEYEQLLLQICTQMRTDRSWGEFFPGEISPFGYNETEAQSVFPLNEILAQDQGFRWSECSVPTPAARAVVAAKDLPDRITEVTDEVLDWAIHEKQGSRPFKIMKSELTFYRNYALPLPHLHPDDRYHELLRKRNPRRLFERTCNLCKAPLMSTYHAEDPRIIACEACYNREVFG